MTTKKLTAEEAVDALQRAVQGNDKQAALDLMCPDDRELLPDWDYEPDMYFDAWNDLVDQAQEKFIYTE